MLTKTGWTRPSQTWPNRKLSSAKYFRVSVYNQTLLENIIETVHITNFELVLKYISLWNNRKIHMDTWKHQSWQLSEPNCLS